MILLDLNFRRGATSGAEGMALLAEGKTVFADTCARCHSSKLPDLPLETSQFHFVRGVCGMARTSDPNSGNSQFFIMFAPAASLDGQYTIWGRVVQGMDYVDQIKRGAPGSGAVSNPDRIVHMRVAADVK